jgi:hypothetical protein
MAWRLADLFIQISAPTQGVATALWGLHARLKGLGAVGGVVSNALNNVALTGIKLQGMLGTGGLITVIGLATAAVGALVFGLGHAAFEAAHLQEAIAKAEQAFGSATPKMLAMADELQYRFGALKKEVLDVAASFGLMLQGAHIGREVSADMSIMLTKMAVDAASYFDVSMTEAIQRMQSGLSGEMEAVRRWGVNLTETNVKRQAMAQGFQPGPGGEFDQNVKTIIRFKLLMEALAPAAGDAERSQYRLIGSWKTLTGEFNRFAVNIGSIVAPVLAMIFQGLIFGLRIVNNGLEMLIERAKEFVRWASFGLISFDDKDAAKRRAEIDEKRKKIQEDQAKDEEDAAKAQAMKDRKGFQGGLEEWAKKIQQGAFGAGKALRTAEQQLKQQQKTNEILEQLKNKFGPNANPAPAVAV